MRKNMQSYVTDYRFLSAALCGLAKSQASFGYVDTALASYERAELLSRQSENALGLVAALDGRATVLALSKNLETSLQLLRDEELVCRENGLLDETLQCLRNQTATLTHLGYLHKAYRRLGEQARLAVTLNDPDERGHAFLCLADLLAKANQPGQALDMVGEVFEMAQRYGLRTLFAQCETVLQVLSLNPARPGPSLDFSANNDLDWAEYDERRIREVLGTVNNVNLRDSRGRTPLMGAVLHGYFKLMSDLLKKNAHVNAHDDEGNTALALATRHHPERRQLAEVLRSFGAKP